MVIPGGKALAAVGLCLLQIACGGTRAVQAHPIPVSGGDSTGRLIPTPVQSIDRQIVPRDLVDVTVFEAPELSRVMRVSDDGMISIPLLGMIQAAGRTPHQLQIALQDTLRRTYMRDPRVIVEVKELAAQPIYVVGEVNQPGAFVPSGQDELTVLRAVAVAKGAKPTAAQGRAIILRPQATGEPLRIPVNLNDVVKGKVPDLVLRPNDVVYVPKNSERVATLAVIDALMRVVTFRAVF